MKTFRSIMLATCSLLFTATLYAQDEKEKGYDPENWFTGGSVSLGLGNGSFNAGLHPHYGYTVAKWIDFAGVANFEYQSQRDLYNNDKHRSTVYGLGVFTRIFPVHFLFIQAQPEYNFIALKTIPFNGTGTVKTNLHAPSVLLGGGYTTSRSGKNTFTYLSILVDVIKDVNSPYVDGYGNLLPIIRAGINIGLNRGKKRK
ncbi:MAG TPA: hypothetical protein VIM07_07225 [Chitinophagaceae bacterium]